MWFIKVGPLKYQVEPMDRTIADLQGIYGCCNKSTQMISIAKDLEPGRYRETLLHEVLHAVWEVQNVMDEDTEERTITALTYGLLDVLRRNPKLVSKLLDKE